MASVTIHGFEFFTGDVPQNTVNKLIIQAIERRCYSKDEEKSKELTEKFHSVYDKEWRFREGYNEPVYSTYDAISEVKEITFTEAKMWVQAKAKEKGVSVKKILSVLRRDERIARLMQEHESQDVEVSLD